MDKGWCKIKANLIDLLYTEKSEGGLMFLRHTKLILQLTLRKFDLLKSIFPFEFSNSLYVKYFYDFWTKQKSRPVIKTRITFFCSSFLAFGMKRNLPIFADNRINCYLQED